MDLNELRAELAGSFADRHLSRKERQLLAAAFSSLDDDSRGVIRAEAFRMARESLAPAEAIEAIEWLETVIDAVHRRPTATAPQPSSEAYFSPGEDCLRRIIASFQYAKKSVDICVFTITDDRISDAILGAKQRGVELRIITDNEKAEDLGSDIERLERGGIPVRVDRSSYHMHHKYAIFDATQLVSGSYNWTRGAADSNEENIIVTTDPKLLKSFSKAFVELWDRLA